MRKGIWYNQGIGSRDQELRRPGDAGRRFCRFGRTATRQRVLGGGIGRTAAQRPAVPDPE